jgi:hypothetical protein
MRYVAVIAYADRELRAYQHFTHAWDNSAVCCQYNSLYLFSASEQERISIKDAEVAFSLEFAISL